MKPTTSSILTLNGGSSSIKFVIYRLDNPLEQKLQGKIDRIGLNATCLNFHDLSNHRQGTISVTANDHKSAANFLIDWLEKQYGFNSIKAVGHRIVHGMQHTEPMRIDQKLINELNNIMSYDPDHLPCEIELIEALLQRHPKLPQVACFDTAFHRNMPLLAKQLPIPRQYYKKGVQRYGFHGLSYSYLLEELTRIAGSRKSKERLIFAHLGNGASLAAIRDGKSIDTSMSLTPTAGLVMSTRSGDLDPGLIAYLSKTEKMSIPQFYKMVNKQSGLLGISEISPDMRDLLEQEANDARAAEAINLFCYQARKWIGSFAAALGGLDTLVFSAGIGENCPSIRARICEGLEFLGIELNPKQNLKNAALISSKDSRVTVRVIHTDEELMIARSVCNVIGLNQSNTKRK